MGLTEGNRLSEWWDQFAIQAGPTPSLGRIKGATDVTLRVAPIPCRGSFISRGYAMEFFLLFAVGAIVINAVLADKKGRSIWGWILAAFLCGLFSTLILACLPPSDGVVKTS